jgi:hypothetical protein
MDVFEVLMRTEEKRVECTLQAFLAFAAEVRGRDSDRPPQRRARGARSPVARSPTPAILRRRRSSHSTSPRSRATRASAAP